MSQGTRITAYQRPVNLLEISKRGDAPVKKETTAPKDTFQSIMSEQLGTSRPVQMSKHASERLYSRGIDMSDERLAQVGQALDKAENKGSRETLILFDDMALVASVKNRTIITAFDREKLREGVVTSIDSAVIL
jgi:flagellar operon protein